MKNEERTGILLIPFASVVVWSCAAALAHVASAHADSTVESHIASVFLPFPQILLCNTPKPKRGTGEKKQTSKQACKKGKRYNAVVGELLARQGGVSWPQETLIRGGVVPLSAMQALR